MLTPSPELGSYGLSPTGLPEVDNKVYEIVADRATRFSADMRSSAVPALSKLIFFGQSVFERGETPYNQRILSDSIGTIDELLLAKEGTPGLPDGYREKASLLWEKEYLRQPPETFPEVTGWQLVMYWGCLEMNKYRAYRAQALYPESGKVIAPDSPLFREDPIVVLSPIILSDHPLNGASTEALERFGMFGRYNQGDVIAAAVDFSQYPFIEEMSFEDEQFMRALIADFFTSDTEQ